MKRRSDSPSRAAGHLPPGELALHPFHPGLARVMREPMTRGLASALGGNRAANRAVAPPPTPHRKR